MQNDILGGSGLLTAHHRLARCPDNRKVTEVEAGKLISVTNDKGNSLTAEAGNCLGKRRLVGKGWDHTKRVYAGNVCGGDNCFDEWVV